jgi:hypothetical protein
VLRVVDNAEKVADVVDCNLTAHRPVQVRFVFTVYTHTANLHARAHTRPRIFGRTSDDPNNRTCAQVCTQGGPDCTPTSPPGCGTTGQRWLAAGLSTGHPATIASAVGNGSHCISVVPLPPWPDIRIQVWAKPLANGDVAFVIFNRASQTYTANVTWSMLGRQDADRLALRDLWAHADLGVFQGSFATPVAPHSAVMVRAAAAI